MTAQLTADLRGARAAIDTALASLAAGPDDTATSMREQLLNERHSCGWSLERTAEKLGVSAAALGSWERGDRDPGLAQREKWAALFGYRIVLQPLAETASPPAGDQ